jgi:SAM-dependent methyltransferase
MAMVMQAPTTALAQQFWSQARTPAEWEQQWVRTDQPHRQAILQSFHLIPAFRSVTEIGCQVGTNLRLIRRAFPWVDCTGIELNPSAVDFAREKFKGDPHVTIERGSLTDPEPLPPTDIFLTCYSLAYVGPTEVLTAIQRMARAAVRGLIVAEPHRPDISQVVPGLPFPEWLHPFDALVGQSLAGRRGRLIVRRLDPPADRLNMVVTAVLL